MLNDCNICEGKLRIFRAMKELEKVPTLNTSYYDTGITDAFNLLDDESQKWSGCPHVSLDYNDMADLKIDGGE